MKTILVTGSSGGIGKPTVLSLLKQDYEVIGLDVKKSDIVHSSFRFFQVDLTSLEALEEVADTLLKENKKLSGIFCLAGIFMMQSMLEGKEEDLRKILEVNFFVNYRLNRVFFPLMEKGSRIILFSSEVARYSPQPFNGYYALSKVIVDRYADILRREYAYLGLKVIKVQCGAVRTGLLSGVDEKYQTMVASSKHFKKPLAKLKVLMDNEIHKQTSPEVIGEKLAALMNKKHPRICYKMKNSFSLSFLNALPEKLQDDLYFRIIH